MDQDEYLPDSWVVIGMGWESRRLTPIIEDLDLDGPALTPQQRMARIVASRNSETDGMRACKRAAAEVVEGFESDEDLRQTFAARGVESVQVALAIVDPAWEPGFKSPRYRLKRSKRNLDVDAWAFYDGPVEPEPFGKWVREQLLGDLQGWLDAHPVGD